MINRRDFLKTAALSTAALNCLPLTCPLGDPIPSTPNVVFIFSDQHRAQSMGYAGLALVAVHLIDLGLGGWMTPGKWTAGLPPISLLACLAALFPLIVKLRSAKS